VDIRQLMIETHRLGNGNPSAFFDGIQGAGFALFSKDPNILVSGNAIEWSFVKIHRDFFGGSVASDKRALDESPRPGS
jgi:Methyltransferase domain